MKKLVLSICSLACLAAAASATAQEEDGPAVGLKAGTTGIGAEFYMPLSEAVNLRLGYNTLDYNTDFDTDDVDYEGDIRKDSVSLVADWHLWDNSFRVSGGVYHHFDNEVEVVGLPTIGGTFEFNDVVYSSLDVGRVRGRADFRQTSPYIGIGWGDATRAGKSFGLTVELGLLYQGSSSVRLAATDCNLPQLACAQLASDLRAEEAELEDDLDDYEWWPVLNVGLTFRF